MRLRPVPKPGLSDDWRDWAQKIVSWIELTLGGPPKDRLALTKAVSASTEMDPGDKVFLTTGTITVTLPDPLKAFEENKSYVVKKLDAATTLTVSGNGGNIDGAASVLLVAQFSVLEVYSDGTNYHRVV